MHVVYHTLQIEPEFTRYALLGISRRVHRAYCEKVESGRFQIVLAPRYSQRGYSENEKFAQRGNRLKVMRSGSTARQIANEYLNPIRECFPGQHRRYVSFSPAKKKYSITVSRSTFYVSHIKCAPCTASEIQIFELLIYIPPKDRYACEMQSPPLHLSEK